MISKMYLISKWTLKNLITIKMVFSQDYESQIQNLQEQVERHSMMSSYVHLEDVQEEEEIPGIYQHLINRWHNKI